MPVSLERTSFGLLVTFAGTITAKELACHLCEARRMVPTSERYGLIVDQHQCQVLEPAALALMDEVIEVYTSRNLERVAIVCGSATVAMQMNRMLAETGAPKIQHHVDGSDPLWESKALDWVQSGTAD